MKKDYKLRIFIYGKNALSDIKYISNTLETRLNDDIKYKVKPYCGVDTESKSKWKYFIFSTEINEDANETIKSYFIEHAEKENLLKANDRIKEVIKKHSNDSNNEILNNEISDILLEYRHFYDILVICVDNLLDEDSKMAFNYFQGFSEEKIKQPFILFLTKKEDNPNVQNLFQFVTKEFFDKRNLFAYKFPTNDKETEEIQKFFRRCMNYYHEVGNNDIKSEIQTFNILICGQAGVGKSCFINQFLQEKVAKEGEGLSVTHEITNYIHPKYPIRLFDTPGFEDDNTVKMVKRTVEKFEMDMKNSKNHLHLILYFNELKQRNFLNLEIEFIKYLLEQNKRIIFVTNDFKNNKKSEIEKLITTLKDSLKKIINTMGAKVAPRTNEILNNIVLINLKQSLIEYEDEEGESKTILKQCYGMDKLFHKIYDIFVKLKISIHEIEAANDVKEMKEKIEKYELLGNIKTLEDIHINIKINSSKSILAYSKFDCFIIFFRDSRRKDLLEKINKLNEGPKIEDIEDEFKSIENEVKKIKDKKDVIEEFFHSIKRFKGTFETEGFEFDAYWYNEYTLLVGYMYLKRFENKIEFGQYDDKSKKFLRKLGTSINKAIDGFLELSKEWENTYKSLKEHKSDKEWINRYFIVELPK